MQESIAIGLSLLKKIVERIDKDTQDIPMVTYTICALKLAVFVK
jgi:hypothetical protein